MKSNHIVLFGPKLDVLQFLKSEIEPCPLLINEDLLKLELNSLLVFCIVFILVSRLMLGRKQEFDFLDSQLWQIVDIVFDLKSVFKIKQDLLLIREEYWNPLDCIFNFDFI